MQKQEELLRKGEEEKENKKGNEGKRARKNSRGRETIKVKQHVSIKMLSWNSLPCFLDFLSFTLKNTGNPVHAQVLTSGHTSGTAPDLLRSQSRPEAFDYTKQT